MMVQIYRAILVVFLHKTVYFSVEKEARLKASFVFYYEAFVGYKRDIKIFGELYINKKSLYIIR